MAKRKSSCFDIDLSEAKRNDLAEELCTEIQQALDARATVIAEGGLIDLYDWFYEQGRSDPNDRPFRGAADLTSYIFTENIDAMRARLLQAVNSAEPKCIVDGWGQDAKKAPTVEAFHDWQASEEGLDEELTKVVHGGLIEDCYVLEVRERIETRRLTEQIDVALHLNDQGGPILEPDAKGIPRPKMQLDEEGEPIEAQPDQPAVKVERTYTKTKRLGPEYDAISMKDFVFLPGHAKNQRQVWGQAYRLWARTPELQEKVEDDIYDKAAVDLMGGMSDREETTAPTSTSDIAPQTGPSVEKELWQLSLKRDLDGDGREEWYLVTLSLKHRVMLRCKLDKFVMKVGRPRCVPLVLFPRRNSVYGYAYAGDKLLTLAEEHTALRNSSADRSALATNAPMTVLQGAALDLDAQPWGVGAAITVRSHEDIKQLTVSDVPQSVIYLLRDVMQAKERVGGLSDVGSIGSGERQSNTLGQDQMVALASSVRVDEPLGHLRRFISEVYKLRHAIWVETLEADSKGMDAPASVAERLSIGGAELQEGKFTAEQIKGKFRFKAYGSVDTANAGMRMQYFNHGLEALMKILQMSPMGALLLQDPDVLMRNLQEWGVAYKVRDVNVFLRAAQKVIQAQQQLPQPGMPAASGMSAGDPMQGEMGGADPMAQLEAMMGGGADAGQGGGEFVQY